MSQFEATLTMGLEAEKTLWHPNLEIAWNYTSEHWEVTDHCIMDDEEIILDTAHPGCELLYYNIIRPSQKIPDIPRTKIKVTVEPVYAEIDVERLLSQAENIHDLAAQVHNKLRSHRFREANSKLENIKLEIKNMYFGKYKQ